MITFGYRNKSEGRIRAILAIIAGLLMLFAKASFGNAIIYIIGVILVIVAVVQLLVFGSIKALAGLGNGSLISTGLILFCAILLFFNPFSINVMRVIAGIGLLVYGINELMSAPKVSRAITDDYGPVGEDRGVDEQ